MVRVRAEHNAAQHEEVGVPVDDVVEQVAALRGFARHLGDFAIQRVEDTVYQHENRADDEPNRPGSLVPETARCEAHAREDGASECAPRQRVRVRVAHGLRHRVQNGVGILAVFV